MSDVTAADVLLVALHRGESGQNGPVLFRLLVPGTLNGSGALDFTLRDRMDLDAGKIYLQVYTRAQPLGAARAQLKIR